LYTFSILHGIYSDGFGMLLDRLLIRQCRIIM